LDVIFERDGSQVKISTPRIIWAFDESTHLFDVKYDGASFGALHHM